MQTEFYGVGGDYTSNVDGGGLRVDFKREGVVGIRALVSYMNPQSQAQGFITCSIELVLAGFTAVNIPFTLTPHATKEFDLGSFHITPGSYIVVNATSAPGGTASEGQVAFTVFAKS